MHCAAHQRLLHDVIATYYETVKGSRENTLSVKKLLQLDAAWLNPMLRYWIEQQGYRMPSEKKITAIQQVLTAKPDRMPCVQWGKVQIRRYQDDLYALSIKQRTHCPTRVITWKITEPLVIPGMGVLQATLVKGEGLRHDIEQVTLRFRQHGEKVRLSGRQGKQTLKHVLQAWRVPSWERHDVPLLFIDDWLISIIGYFIDKNYIAQADDMGWKLHWMGY
jgi:tRNA(Ile)-lysidine synthase